MARFLIVSCLAETSALAIRLMAEGHEVRYYIHSEAENDVGDGFLDKVDNWREWVEWADLVFFDDVRQKQKGEELYDSGKWFLEVKEKYPDKLVIGGPNEVSKLENDRIYGNQIAQEYGIETVPLERFTSFQDAIKFLEENGGRWALKHCGQVDRDLAYVAKDEQDMIEFLQWLDENWAELGENKPVDFVLQDASTEGVEIATTAFFDGQKFRREAIYLNQEIKRELTGDLGRRTGQMGEVGLIIPNSKLFEATLGKIEPYLQKYGYCGFADINLIVSEDKIVPLEFTIGRPGYPTLFSFLEILAEPVGEWLIRMAQQDPSPIQMHPAVNCTLVLATGSFPDQHPTRNKLAIVHGLEKIGLRHVWLCETRFEDGKVYGAGTMGYLAVITGKGNSIPEAVENAYKIIEQIKVIPFEKYRLDIGERAAEEFPKLWQWRWLQ